MDDDFDSFVHSRVLVQVFLFFNWTKRQNPTDFLTAVVVSRRSDFAVGAIEVIDIAVRFARI